MEGKTPEPVKSISGLDELILIEALLYSIGMPSLSICKISIVNQYAVLTYSSNHTEAGKLL